MMENQLLQVKNLVVSFTNEESTTRAVQSVSLHIKAGETLGIVGESGSGKSVTALSILRLIESPSGKIEEGEILFQPEPNRCLDLVQLSENEMQQIRGESISMIFQEPMTSLNPVLTCGFQVGEVLREHLRYSKSEAKKRVIELFQEVQLPRPEKIYDSYPHEISGGQKQRVMIAMAIACKPRLLIADEPTTALDVTVQKTILELLKTIQVKHRMSILFITHDLGLISGFADRIAVMYKGRIVEEKSSRELFEHPEHPYTKGLLSCRPPLDVRLKRLTTVSDFMNQDATIKSGQPAIETTEERQLRHRHLYAQPPLLEVNDLVTQFVLEKNIFGKPKRLLHAVDHVSFSVFPGETMGIVGESGCGKTTLGRTILNLVKATSGQIKYDGKAINTLTYTELRSVRKELQIIFQDPYSSLNPRLMVGTAITEPMKVHGLHGDAHSRKEVAIQLLQKVGLEAQHYYRYPHEFSGGQRQRVCIARALALQPRVIICDESVSALDVSIQAQVLNLLNDLKSEFQFTYLFISHDLSVVKFMSDRIMVMKAGKVEEMGDPDEIYAHPASEYTKRLLEAIPRIEE